MRIRNIILCALFAALLCICAWIAIPLGNSVITLQTFALFLTLGLLGGKRGSIVCLVYLLLGAAGLPVFSGFRGGLGMLFGATGGYLFGFLAAALTYWAITSLFKESASVQLLATLSAMAICYFFGAGWFLWIWHPPGSPEGFGAALLVCVVPYLLPDAIKLFLAILLTKRLRQHVF